MKKKFQKFVEDCKNFWNLKKHFYYVKNNFSIKGCWRYLLSNFSIWHVLSIDGMLKIAFLYSVVVMYIILTNVTLPSFNDKRETISIYGTSDRIGEGLLHDRILIAANNIGFRTISVRFSEEDSRYFLTSHFYKAALNLLNLVYEPKFNLATTHYFFVVPYAKCNLIYLNMPNNSLINREGFVKAYPHLNQYDVYLDLHSVANGSNPKLINALKKSKNPNAPIIPLYLSHHAVPYSAAKMEKMLVVGSLWGCNRGAERTKDTLYRLAEDDLLVAYGLKDLDFLDAGYKGSVDDYNKNNNASTNLFNLQKEFGISLVIHALEHMVDNIPTSRIAESVSAGTIVISDNNGFIKQVFGDSVLYFDSVVQEDKLYQQLKDHINWIKAHPKEAEEKSRRAHEIFTETFTIEKQLTKLCDELKKLKVID